MPKYRAQRLVGRTSRSYRASSDLCQHVLDCHGNHREENRRADQRTAVPMLRKCRASLGLIVLSARRDVQARAPTSGLNVIVSCVNVFYVLSPSALNQRCAFKHILPFKTEMMRLKPDTVNLCSVHADAPNDIYNAGNKKKSRMGKKTGKWILYTGST